MSMSASIIAAIGLQKPLTCNLETYETMAVPLALDSGQLNGIRNKLEQNRLTQSLFDTDRFTTNLENVFKEMMRILAAGKRLRRITVTDE